MKKKSIKVEIVDLKEELEKAYASFSSVGQRIASLGYSISMNPDGTTYVFRDTRESFGENKIPPQQVAK